MSRLAYARLALPESAPRDNIDPSGAGNHQYHAHELCGTSRTCSCHSWSERSSTEVAVVTAAYLQFPGTHSRMRRHSLLEGRSGSKPYRVPGSGPRRFAS
ncbi:hypothetical protein LIER_12225 [Lithospermum erythrorhizon]|uniref:Uncharacterized protein n=1 Tax=Lithospermum erythrorhizon TaxID=34254 RepID=A0AAV3PQY5_LITER